MTRRLEKRVYGVGYLGEGEYEPFEAGGKMSKAYQCWHSMMMRAYSDNYHRKRPSYKNVTVCEEWHCFQNFAKFFYENYYEIKGFKTSLDKDFIKKGNKIYSKENCVFVPSFINSLIENRKALRGKYPIGVSYDKKRRKYQSKIVVDGKTINLGRYRTYEEAFYVYKKNKEQRIKDVAEKYKKEIPQKLYEAMQRYKIEIDD